MRKQLPDDLKETGIYWLEVGSESTISHSAGNWLWKFLQTCDKLRDYNYDYDDGLQYILLGRSMQHFAATSFPIHHSLLS